MSLHTGIVPNKEIDVSEFNLPTKKYVDDGLKLKVDKTGDTMSGPLSMNDGKIWDLASGTLDNNAVNKKYVDDADNLKLVKTGGTLLGELSMDDNKITDLATPTSNTDAATKKYVDDNNVDKISDIDVVDESFTAGSDIQIRVGSRTVGCVQNKLLSSDISPIIEKHFHLSYTGNASGFSTTGGKQVIVWGGFNSISGRCTFASIKLRGMGWTETITKMQLYSSDNTSGLSFASNAITDAKTGSFLNGTYVIPIGAHLHFSNITYPALYMEGVATRTDIAFELFVDLAIE